MWNRRKARKALATIGAYSKPYSWLVARGALATIGVVFLRLAMPWPLRSVVEVVFPQNGGNDPAFFSVLPADSDPIAWLGLSYVLMAIGVGLCELWLRVSMKRYASHAVHDMRRDAVASALRHGSTKAAGTGDLIVRITGDTARLKTHLSGIAVHVFQNGLLFLAVSGVMLWMSPRLGFFFLIAGVLVVIIGFSASGAVADTSRKQRQREGEYAAAVYAGFERGALDRNIEDINADSARKEVRTTKLIAQSALLIHTVLATTVALALWYGAQDVAAGRLSPGDIFLFIAYALTVHRRMVQVGRQAARTGKALACAERIGNLIETQDINAVFEIKPLLRELRLEGVKLRSLRHGRKRLKKSHLSIAAGSKVAIIGRTGSGKTSLLRLIAGAETHGKGRIYWDDEEVDQAEVLQARSEYLAQSPSFPRQRLWKTLGLEGPQAKEQERAFLKRLGAWPIIKAMPRRLNHKGSSTDFSHNEVRTLALAAILNRGDAPLWILDSPLEGTSGKHGRQRLAQILDGAQGHTVIVALARRISLEQFDRVISMYRGRVDFDGTPAAWQARKDPDDRVDDYATV